MKILLRFHVLFFRYLYSAVCILLFFSRYYLLY